MCKTRARIVLLVLTVAITVALSASAATTRHLSLMLDWTPNPDHLGLYYAREQGIFADEGLSVTMRSPSDPTAPLKLVAVGRTDLAVSYEQEVFYAAAKGVPVIAVAAIVPHPLNSLMWINQSIASISDLKGHQIGITGVPSDYAVLKTILATKRLELNDVHVVSVGYNLLPALLSHKVDAVIGVYRNVEGVELVRRNLHPTVIPVDEAGIPPYDELVLVANKQRLTKDVGYSRSVRRFVAAFIRGTAEARAHPARSLRILSQVTAADPKFLAASTPLTLRLLAGPHGPGCLQTSDWHRFGTWMATHHLLDRPISIRTVVTTRFLPGRCSSR